MLPGAATRELAKLLSQAGLSVSESLFSHTDSCKWSVPAGHELLVSTDTLVADVHFPGDEVPEAIAYKALAVNLSDIAAMGGKPVAVGLVLSLPEYKNDWLTAWVEGFAALAKQHELQLSHVETLTGELMMHVQIYGIIEQGKAIKRSTASIGELVCVTGTLGDAACGLKLLKQQGRAALRGTEQAYLLGRLQRPEPRIAAGQGLVGLAGSCIDISDGLLADLGHICTQSGVGAAIELEKLPLSAQFRAVCADPDRETLALAGGDDYELCFTLAPDKQQDIQQDFAQSGIPVTVIGRIVQEPGITVYDKDRNQWHGTEKGYDHFGTVKT